MARSFRRVIEAHGPGKEGFLKVSVGHHTRNREPWAEIAGDSYRYRATYDLMALFKTLQAACHPHEQHGLTVAGGMPPYIHCPRRLVPMALAWITAQPGEWIVGSRGQEHAPAVLKVTRA